MNVGYRLRQIREFKNLSQGDIEERTGLLRCYISRVENGHTVPSIETLEKMSRALEIPMYQLFFNGEQTAEQDPSNKSHSNGHQDWASYRKGDRMLNMFRYALAKMSDKDRSFLLYMAGRMAERDKR
jgi:transcriptional regulator with XRE-family HTH domain